MMWDWHGDWSWVWGALMMFGWIAVIAVAVCWGRGTSPRRPREILDERYARGEITTEEYEEHINRML